jgi:hypothetical protein
VRIVTVSTLAAGGVQVRDTAAAGQLWRLVEQQTALNVPAVPDSSTDAVPMFTPDAE